ncbi:MAG: hypothetical protein AAGE52_17605 [Myxococcota bacterium]
MTFILVVLAGGDVGAQAEPAGETGVERAEPEPFLRQIPGVWTLIGATTGTLFERGEGSLFAGAEVSYVHYLRTHLWYGVVAEIRWEERAKAAVALGLEGGYGPLVVEAAMFGRFPRRAGFGIRGRSCVSVLAVVSFCVGGAVLSGGHRVREIGLVLKYPRRFRD